jgi:hypothetical protein
MDCERENVFMRKQSLRMGERHENKEGREIVSRFIVNASQWLAAKAA